MVRVKRGITSLKHRRKVLKQAKGYRFGRSTKERMAKEAIFHAGIHAYHDRRKKKSNMRGLWQTKISASAQTQNISYSKLMGKLKKANIKLNRKILATLAEKEPVVFSKIIEEVSEL